MRIVNKVKQYRKAARMTQSQLAERAGVSRQTISDIETGKHDPTISVALLLARALGVKVDNLFKLINWSGDIG